MCWALLKSQEDPPIFSWPVRAHVLDRFTNVLQAEDFGPPLSAISKENVPETRKSEATKTKRQTHASVAGHALSFALS